MRNARFCAFPVCGTQRARLDAEGEALAPPAQIASNFRRSPANSIRISRRGGLRPPAFHHHAHRREASPDASGLDSFRTERGGIRGCLPTFTRAKRSAFVGADDPVKSNMVYNVVRTSYTGLQS